MLPFKTIKQKNTELIEDGLGHSLEVPKYGCFTYNEMLAFDAVLANTEKIDHEFRTNLVATMLMLRFKLAPGTKADEILVDDEGNSVAQTLIDALYEFFLAERNRHTPTNQSLRVEGVDANKIASRAAKSRLQCVVSLGDVYLVVDEPIDGSGWELVEDYREQTEDEGSKKK